MERFKQPRVFPASGSIARACHELLAAAPPEGTLQHRSHLLGIVALLLSEQFRLASSGNPEVAAGDEHFLHILDSFSVADLIMMPVQEVAARFGCSRRQLNRLLHRHFGKSACALKIEMRLLRAALLLRDPANKVINVAEQCGFNHLGLFNTCFKRRFGVCPSIWRQKSPARSVRGQNLLRGHPDCQVRARGLCAWSQAPRLADSHSHAA